MPPFSSQAAKEEQNRGEAVEGREPWSISLRIVEWGNAAERASVNVQVSLSNSLENDTIQISYQIFFNKLLIAEQDLLTA